MFKSQYIIQYNPSEQDWKDFERSESLERHHYIIVANGKKLTLSKYQFGYVAMGACIKYYEEHQDACKYDFMEYCEMTYPGFVHCFKKYVDISSRDFKDLIEEKQYPYLISAWNILFNLDKCYKIINDRRNLMSLIRRIEKNKNNNVLYTKLQKEVPFIKLLLDKSNKQPLDLFSMYIKNTNYDAALWRKVLLEEQIL